MTNRQEIKFDLLWELYQEKDEQRALLCRAPLYIEPQEEHVERFKELNNELVEISRQLAFAI